MKSCAYCGRLNSDETIRCCECGTEEFGDLALANSPAATDSSSFTPAPLTPEEMQKDLVTVMTCRTLAEADLIVSRLEGAGVGAFIPDQFFLQAVCWNLNTYGYVRIQISPKDYEAAKEVLSTPAQTT